MTSPFTVPVKFEKLCILKNTIDNKEKKGTLKGSIVC